MSVGNDDDVAMLLLLHALFLERCYLRDDFVKALADLSGRFAFWALCAVPPDIPWPLLVMPSCLTELSDLMREQALVVGVRPFPDLLSLRCLVLDIFSARLVRELF